MRGVTPGLVLLRAAALAALVLLIWNPATARRAADTAPPIVLLDASLSMAGTPQDPDRWRRALDSARALARGGVVWRFGRRVAAFDTAPPADGASRLGPALEAAAARGGAVIVVTDGAVGDLAALPPDLRQRPRIVTIERPPSFDAFVAGIEGPRYAGTGDTVRLRVSYGTAGKGEGGSGKRTATLAINVGGQRLLSRGVTLPDSGIVSTELTLPVSRIPGPGWSALEVRLEGVDDPEPRDDARLHLLEVSTQPRAVLLAAPPDWDTRFLATALRDVARVAVRVFVQTDGGRWRDGTTLQPVAAGEVARAVAAARLVVLG
ncbi:MAG: vWA domain-containing protein, partial [Gemmatimonadales bacterium]